jgi:OmpA-OmpF porin, OOP family
MNIMKKCFIAVLALAISFGTNAQDNYKKAPQLLINIGFTDFVTPANIKTSSISSVLSNKQWAKFNQVELTAGFSYLTGLSSHLDFNGTLNASFVNYPFTDRPITGKNLLLTSEAAVNVKLLTDKALCVPFLTGGVGVSMSKNVFGAYMPVGTGLQFRLADEGFILLNFQYRIPVTETVNNNFFYGLGIATKLGK